MWYKLVNSTAELDDLNNSSTEADHGYSPDTSGTQKKDVSVTGHWESAVKIETMHYLDNPSKELSSLLAYRHVKAAFVKYYTTRRPQRLLNDYLVLVT